jgi:uracil phosphoribosyltransferase
MASQQPALTVVDHPLVAAKLSVLRAKATAPNEFRRNLQELSALLLCEAARLWETEPIVIETPLENMIGSRLSRPIVLVPILRAGLGMLEGMQRVLPDAGIGHIGVYRDEITLRPVSYFCRLPARLAESQVLLLDPMLATGHSACAAVAELKAQGARRIQLVCIVGCPAGVAQLHAEHPDVPIMAAAIDPILNGVGYIVPGLGDAGDRYFGTG